MGVKFTSMLLYDTDDDVNRTEPHIGFRVAQDGYFPCQLYPTKRWKRRCRLFTFLPLDAEVLNIDKQFAKRAFVVVSLKNI